MSDTTKIRIQQAEESLEEASVIKDFDVSNLAILTKLYHAMIYALMALFEIEEIGSLTHNDLIERFDQEYVKTGKTPEKFIDALRFAYSFTHECDCAMMKEPESKDILYLLPLADEFVKELRRFMTTFRFSGERKEKGDI